MHEHFLRLGSPFAVWRKRMGHGRREEQRNPTDSASLHWQGSQPRVLVLVSKAADTTQAARAGARRGSSSLPCCAAVRQNKPCFMSRSTTWQQQDEQCHKELQLLILAPTNDSTSHCVKPCRAGNAVMFCLKQTSSKPLCFLPSFSWHGTSLLQRVRS